MMRKAILAAGLVTVSLLPSACQDSRSQPTGPTDAVGGTSFGRDHDDGDHDGHRSFLKLVSVVGPGRGALRATRVPHPTIPGNFAAHFEVRIRHAKRNTVYVVQRAAETLPPAGVDPATTIDGSCQRGLAIAPWSTLAPAPAAFVSFPDQGTGTPGITTDDHGNGAADFAFASTSSLPLFDVMFRVIEISPTPTSALVTDCTNLPLLP